MENKQDDRFVLGRNESGGNFCNLEGERHLNSFYETQYAKGTRSEVANASTHHDDKSSGGQRQNDIRADA
jgi:hypothetical protein